MSKTKKQIKEAMEGLTGEKAGEYDRRIEEITDEYFELIDKEGIEISLLLATQIILDIITRFKSRKIRKSILKLVRELMDRM